MKRVLVTIVIVCFALLSTNQLNAQQNMGYNANSNEGGFRVEKVRDYGRKSHLNRFNENKEDMEDYATSVGDHKQQMSENYSSSRPNKNASCKSGKSCAKTHGKSGSKHWDYSDHSDLRDMPNLKKEHCGSNASNCSKGKQTSCSKDKAVCNTGSKKACAGKMANGNCGHASKGGSCSKKSDKKSCSSASCGHAHKEVSSTCEKDCAKPCCNKKPTTSRYNRY